MSITMISAIAIGEWPEGILVTGGVHLENGRLIKVVALDKTGTLTHGKTVVTDVSAESLVGFIQETVEPGTTIYTGGWKSYSGLPAAGYKHCASVINSGDEQAHEVMPRVHNVASLLKRWLLGTLQGGVQQQHLDYYLDEFTFRFNRRRSSARGLLFHRLAQQAVAVDPAPQFHCLRQTGATGVKGIPICHKAKSPTQGWAFYFIGV